MQTFLADLKQAEELLAWEASQATEAERWTKLFGPAFQGVGTDWDRLRKAITWARKIRRVSPHLRKCCSKPPWERRRLSRGIAHALEPYEHALHGFEIRFDAPGPQLTAKRSRSIRPKRSSIC